MTDTAAWVLECVCWVNFDDGVALVFNCLSVSRKNTRDWTKDGNERLFTPPESSCGVVTFRILLVHYWRLKLLFGLFDALGAVIQPFLLGIPFRGGRRCKSKALRRQKRRLHRAISANVVGSYFILPPVRACFLRIAAGRRVSTTKGSSFPMLRWN